MADLFVEDRAHEAFLRPLLQRVAGERKKAVDLRIRSARGGHGRVLSELDLYQRAISKHPGSLALPDLLVVGTDANCRSHQVARKDVETRLGDAFRLRTVVACPDPHIERWFLADAEAVRRVIGGRASVQKSKCERNYYKAMLRQAVVEGGQVSTLGGIEFAPELVAAMDFYRAGKVDHSLKFFLDEIRTALDRF
ncbi:MAG: hypothetical protein HY718_18525 [Planctomycetes bacterium]|nr:hypothetical protein [Planctomycetota bacterium]